MKFVILILLLIANAIFPNVMFLFPIFVAYCFPNKFNFGYKKICNYTINVVICYVLILLPFLIGMFFPKLSVINSLIRFLKKIQLFDAFFYCIISITILLIFKYLYEIEITKKDMIIHSVGLLLINFLSYPLGKNLLSYSDFRPFIMSLQLLFIFYSLYCIWKVNQHEKQKNVEII